MQSEGVKPRLGFTPFFLIWFSLSGRERFWTRTPRSLLAFHPPNPSHRLSVACCYTNLIFLFPYPASHQGGMRNRRSSEIMGLLVSSVWFCLLVGCLRCLRRPTFFQQQKKVGKKCRSHAPRGWHSANAFVTERHASACKVGYIIAVGCETALRAVRDGFI